MRYEEFKDAIRNYLMRHRDGATWNTLRADLALPYRRPCPEWTRHLEADIGLLRKKAGGNSLVWSIGRLRR